MHINFKADELVFLGEVSPGARARLVRCELMEFILVLLADLEKVNLVFHVVFPNKGFDVGGSCLVHLLHEKFRIFLNCFWSKLLKIEVLVTGVDDYPQTAQVVHLLLQVLNAVLGNEVAIPALHSVHIIARSQ